MLMENPIPSSLLRPPLKESFSKEKRKKRKQESSVRLQDASAISPEGRAKGNEGRYVHAACAGHYLSCPFSPFRMKTATPLYSKSMRCNKPNVH